MRKKRDFGHQTKHTSKILYIISVISDATYLHIGFICQVEELKQDNNDDGSGNPS